jgi:tRNA-(ms[2]io[6]A)-hydroxylase
MKNDLRYQTPESWADFPLTQPLALLSDHAYLERKAASNALELLNRWPEPQRPSHWALTLSSIARDEAMHLQQVLRLLADRGGRLERLHRSSYANDLRALVRRGEGPREIMDRLLVSALIEARSCERFFILGRKAQDQELASFYRGLCVSEMGHYKVFLSLAEETVERAEAQARWDEMVEREAVIVRAQPAGPGLHSGLAAVSVS